MSPTGCVCLYPAAQGRDKQKNKTEDVFSVGKALLLKGEPTVSNRETKEQLSKLSCFTAVVIIFQNSLSGSSSRSFSLGVTTIGLIMVGHAVLLHMTLWKSPFFFSMSVETGRRVKVEL